MTFGIEQESLVKTRNLNFESLVRAIFNQAPFITDIGLELKDVGPGWCESELRLLPKHLQQDGYVHAGVLATMTDHTAGAAGGALVGENETVLTVEFKINLLRPAQGERLQCRGQVIKPGKNLIVAESEVYCFNKEQSSFVAKATVTLAVVEASPGTTRLRDTLLGD